MTRRIRGAIQNSFLGVVIEGTIEIDEAVIHADGGKAGGNTPFNTKDVIGMTSRESGILRLVVLEKLWKSEIKRVCMSNLRNVYSIYTDAALRLRFLKMYGITSTSNTIWAMRMVQCMRIPSKAHGRYSNAV